MFVCSYVHASLPAGRGHTWGQCTERWRGRQSAQQALDVADDHALAVVQDGEGEELDFLQVGAAAASAERGQADLRDDFEQVLGDFIHPKAGAGGHECSSLRAGAADTAALAYCVASGARPRNVGSDACHFMIITDRGLSIGKRRKPGGPGDLGRKRPDVRDLAPLPGLRAAASQCQKQTAATTRAVTTPRASSTPTR